jgi:glyoxylase I family protein
MPENKKIKGCGFHHVFLKVSNLENSLKFYKEGLGFVEKTSWGQGAGKMVLLDTGDGNYFELSQGSPDQIKEGGIYLHLALRTDDCDASLEAARAAGAMVTMEPRDVNIPSNPVLPVRIAFFKGPDGEVIELFQNELT